MGRWVDGLMEERRKKIIRDYHYFIIIFGWTEREQKGGVFAGRGGGMSISRGLPPY